MPVELAKDFSLAAIERRGFGSDWRDLAKAGPQTSGCCTLASKCFNKVSLRNTEAPPNPWPWRGRWPPHWHAHCHRTPGRHPWRTWAIVPARLKPAPFWAMASGVLRSLGCRSQIWRFISRGAAEHFGHFQSRRVLARRAATDVTKNASNAVSTARTVTRHWQPAVWIAVDGSRGIGASAGFHASKIGRPRLIIYAAVSHYPVVRSRQ